MAPESLAFTAKDGPYPFVEPFQRFFRKAVSGSLPLFAAAIAALLWANIAPHHYHAVWHAPLSLQLGPLEITKPVVHWIDEALMALFLLLVGLEIKRMVLVGELASFKRAALPVAAAVGGMLLPALVYTAVNYGGAGMAGWGIPMATDIAFSLAVLAALGSRIPIGLKIFLSAFAIADDLGAVLVIALFYTRAITGAYLLGAAGFLAALILANRLWIRHAVVYALLGIGLWVCMLGSGVHAALAGVLVAILIPARAIYDTETFIGKIRSYLDRFECAEDSCGFTILLNREHLNAVQNIQDACDDVKPPLQTLEHNLHGWISYLVLPLFALANAGLHLGHLDMGTSLGHPVTLGIVLGLAVGKPCGVALFTWLAHRLLNAPLPSGVTWRHVLGAGILGGIGFTMSLFISGLSFGDPALAASAKLGSLAASVLTGMAGLIYLLAADRRG